MNPETSIDRDDALDQTLKRMRLQAGLSVAQVCQATKIQTRYVEALEAGRFGELPSNTHLRAFSLSLAQVCGGDEERVWPAVRRVLIASGAIAAPPIVETPAMPAPITPIKAAPAPMASVVTVAPVAPAVVAREVAEEAAHAAEGLVQNASQKLRALPWQALLAMATLAALLSGTLLWAVHRWQARGMEVAPVVVEETVKAPVTAKPAKAGAAPSAAVVAAAADATVAEPAAPVPATQLVLRARRSCWLVLQVDGQKLPTVTLEEGEKRSWPVSQKAIVLAGNIGALRVWWRGDNLGYLGELSTRQNGLVFEPGKNFRVDHAVDLPLPAGVPE